MRLISDNSRINHSFNRRGDHVEYQKEHNSQVISEDYFLDAMDMYRLVWPWESNN